MFKMTLTSLALSLACIWYTQSVDGPSPTGSCGNWTPGLWPPKLKSRNIIWDSRAKDYSHRNSLDSARTLHYNHLYPWGKVDCQWVVKKPKDYLVNTTNRDLEISKQFKRFEKAQLQITRGFKLTSICSFQLWFAIWFNHCGQKGY